MVLGILWDGKNDNLLFNFEEIVDGTLSLALTNRSIVSIVQ